MCGVLGLVLSAQVAWNVGQSLSAMEWELQPPQTKNSGVWLVFATLAGMLR